MLLALHLQVTSHAAQGFGIEPAFPGGFERILAMNYLPCRHQILRRLRGENLGELQALRAEKLLNGGLLICNFLVASIVVLDDVIRREWILVQLGAFEDS